MTRYDHGHPVDESRKCWAKTKTGRQCRNNALVGKPYCALHGGQAAAYQQKGVEALARVTEEMAAEDEEKKRELRAYAERQLSKLLRRPPTEEEARHVVQHASGGLHSLPTKKQIRETAEDYARVRGSVVKRGAAWKR